MAQLDHRIFGAKPAPKPAPRPAPPPPTTNGAPRPAPVITDYASL